MYTDVLMQTQREWSTQALFLVREILPLMAPVATYEAWSPSERSIVGMLLTASARSTESVLLLSAYGQLWDAEVVMRSVCESSLKLAYMLQSRESFNERISEYSEDSFQLSLLKDDKKIREFLAVVENPDSPGWKPLRDRLLSEEERVVIEKKYDKSARRSMDSRWGFTGIVGSFQRDKDPLLANSSGLAHGYSLASHINHADYLGVIIALERDCREPEARDSLHLAHLARLISDSFAYLTIRLSVGYRFVACDVEPIRRAQEKIKELHDSFGDVYGQWMKGEYGG